MTRRNLIKGVLAMFAGRGMTAWPTLEAAKASWSGLSVLDGINRSKFKFWSTDLGGLNAYHQCLPVCNPGELLAQGWERGIARHAHEDPFCVKMSSDQLQKMMK